MATQCLRLCVTSVGKECNKRAQWWLNRSSGNVVISWCRTYFPSPLWECHLLKTVGARPSPTQWRWHSSEPYKGIHGRLSTPCFMYFYANLTYLISIYIVNTTWDLHVLSKAWAANSQSISVRKFRVVKPCRQSLKVWGPIMILEGDIQLLYC